MELDFTINHYRQEEDRVYATEDWSFFPVDLNYVTGLRVGVQKQPIDYKSLRVAKRYYISHEPNTGERLPEPIYLVLEKYLYAKNTRGEFTSQDKRAYFYLTDGSLYQDEYKLIPKDLNTPDLQEKIVSNRRAAVFPYLKGRARQIDAVTGNQYNLTAKIEDFFDKFIVLKAKYVESGSLKITDSIQSILDVESSTADWLKTEIPIATDPATGQPIFAVTGKVIQQTLIDATTDITAEEIDRYLEGSF